MSKNTLKQSIRSFMTSEEFLFDTSPKKIEKKLAAYMGKERYESYCDVAGQMRAGEVGIAELYRCMDSLTSAHVLFSHQTNVSLDIYAAMVAALSRLEPAPESILDCGCGTGVFARWLAEHFPAAQVTGCDRAEHFVRVASERQSAADFQVWSYEAGAPTPTLFDALIACLGIDFPNVDYPQLEDGHSWRSSNHYRERVAYLTPIFRAWRSCAVDKGVLLTILRVPGPEELLPLIDAATTAGWKLDHDHFERVLVGGWEHIPFCRFTVAEPNMMSEMEILLCWQQADHSEE